MRTITVTVNAREHTAEVEPRQALVYFLREQLGLTGTNVGCDTSSCGACTVLLDGESVKACTLLAVQADGREVTTIEGLAQNGELHPMQQAFHEHHALQCGFCTPGMVWRRYPCCARTRARPRTRCVTRSRATSAAARGTTTSSRPCWRRRNRDSQ
jgi:carbon-monoxide dehydrogenase small subunit